METSPVTDTPPSYDPTIAQMYTALNYLTSDRDTAVIVADVITRQAATVHPAGKEDLREVTIDGVVYTVDVGDRFGRAFFYGDRPERVDLALFLALCPAGGEIWDVGANFGLYAAAAGVKAGPESRVHAFEPNKAVLRLLERNLAANGVSDRATVHDVALSDYTGTATFFEAEESAFSGLTDTGRSKVKEATEVAVRRLDDLWQAAGGKPIDLLKVDVEGHEGAVFFGARAALAASPRVVVQFEVSQKNLDTDRRNRLVDALAALEDEGFALWVASPGATHLKAVSARQDLAEGTAEGNLFMVQAGSARETAMKSAADAILGQVPERSDGEKALLALLPILTGRYREAEELYRALQVDAKTTLERYHGELQRYRDLQTEAEDALRRSSERADSLSRKADDLTELAQNLSGKIESQAGTIQELSNMIRNLTRKNERLDHEIHRVSDALSGAQAAQATRLAARPLAAPPLAVSDIERAEGLSVLLTGEESDTIARLTETLADESRPLTVDRLGAAPIGAVSLADDRGLFAPAAGPDASLTAAAAANYGTGPVLVATPDASLTRETVEAALRTLSQAAEGSVPAAVVLAGGSALLASAQTLRTGLPAGSALPPMVDALASRLTALGVPLLGDPVSQAPTPIPTLPTDAFALPAMPKIGAIVLAMGRRPAMGAAASAALTACEGRCTGVDVVDYRPERDGEPDLPKGVGYIAPSGASPQLRHGRAMAAALSVCQGDVALIIGSTSVVCHHDIRRALMLWRQAAAKGQAVAGVSFGLAPISGPAEIHHERYAGRPVLRAGLVSLPVIRALGAGHILALGSGFEVDLSLRLQRAGFSILETGADAPCFTQAPLPPSPPEDRVVLDRFWGPQS